MTAKKKMTGRQGKKTGSREEEAGQREKKADATPIRIISPSHLLLCVLAGLIGSAAFIFLFPGASITTAMHDVLELPGPGAGIGLLYGPFIILVAAVVHRIVRRPLAILMTCVSFGVFHAILAPVVYADAKTAGTIGPPHLRILAVVALGLVLEGVVFILKDTRPLVRYPLASIPANSAIMFVYFCAIFPDSPKGTVDPSNVPVLLGVTVLGAVTIGGLLPVLIHLLFLRRRDSQENE